jgi:hypothetical protein
MVDVAQVEVGGRGVGVRLEESQVLLGHLLHQDAVVSLRRLTSVCRTEIRSYAQGCM